MDTYMTAHLEKENQTTKRHKIQVITGITYLGKSKNDLLEIFYLCKSEIRTKP